MAKYNVGDVVKVTHKSDRWIHHFNENIPVAIIDVYSEDTYEAVDVWNIKQTLHESHIVGLWERQKPNEDKLDKEPKEEEEAVDLTNKEPEIGDYITLKPFEECKVKVNLDRSRPIKINDITKTFLFGHDVYWVTGYDIFGKPLQQMVIRECIESVALPPEEEVPEDEHAKIFKELTKFMYDL